MSLETAALEQYFASDARLALDPPVSEAQRRAMHAAAAGKSTLGIPKSVGKEFSDADKPGKLPKRKTAKDEYSALDKAFNAEDVLGGAVSSGGGYHKLAGRSGLAPKTPLPAIAKGKQPTAPAAPKTTEEKEKAKTEASPSTAYMAGHVIGKTAKSTVETGKEAVTGILKGVSKDSKNAVSAEARASGIESRREKYGSVPASQFKSRRVEWSETKRRAGKYGTSPHEIANTRGWSNPKGGKDSIADTTQDEWSAVERAKAAKQHAEEDKRSSEVKKRNKEHMRKHHPKDKDAMRFDGDSIKDTSQDGLRSALRDVGGKVKKAASWGPRPHKLAESYEGKDLTRKDQPNKETIRRISARQSSYA